MLVYQWWLFIRNDIIIGIFRSQEIENDDEKPVKLHDELDSFYSDIASIEATFTQTSQTEQPVVKVEEAPIPAPLPAPKPAAIIDTSASQDKPVKSEDKVVKKKKKVMK